MSDSYWPSQRKKGMKEEELPDPLNAPLPSFGPSVPSIMASMSYFSTSRVDSFNFPYPGAGVPRDIQSKPIVALSKIRGNVSENLEKELTEVGRRKLKNIK